MYSAPAGLTRPPNREPIYSGIAAYCALLFSAEAGGCVWLARDDGNLYVDRQGLGNLTGPNQQIELPRSRLGEPIDAGDLFPRGVDGPVRLKLHQFLVGRDVTIYLHVWFSDGRREGSSPVWSPEPRSAPQIFFYGPLTFMPCSSSPVVSTGGTSKLEVQLGRPGVGDGAFAWRNHSDVPRDIHPRAAMRFESTKGTPHSETYLLEQRCCGCRFFGSIAVPPSVAGASVEVSFDDWSAGAVVPGRFNVTCE